MMIIVNPLTAIILMCYGLFQILHYLLEYGYYKYFRYLVDDRIPPMIEPREDPPTPFAASLIDFIQRPLKLAFEKRDSIYK